PCTLHSRAIPRPVCRVLGTRRLPPVTGIETDGRQEEGAPCIRSPVCQGHKLGGAPPIYFMTSRLPKSCRRAESPDDRFARRPSVMAEVEQALAPTVDADERT